MTADAFCWAVFGWQLATIGVRAATLSVCPYPLPRKPVERRETWIQLFVSVAIATWAWTALHAP